jgi:hypothetical protein
VHRVALLGGLVLASALVDDPVGSLVRGKWVRYWDTGTGEHTATMCLPARNGEELAAQVQELPSRVVGLREAGASVVVVDLDAELVRPLVDAGALPLEDWLVLPHGTASKNASEGSRVQHRGPVSGMAYGLPAHGESPPMALVAVARYRGVEEPVQTDHGWVVEELGHRADGLHHQFMPYLIPFAHWEQPETWAVGRDRIVSIGACRLDRDVTRYGRQPSSVAHGEWIETVLAGQDPREAPWWLDALAGLAVLGVGSRWKGSRGAVSVLGVASVLLVSLSGMWMSLLPPLVAAAACVGQAMSRRISARGLF